MAQPDIPQVHANYMVAEAPAGAANLANENALNQAHADIAALTPEQQEIRRLQALCENLKQHLKMLKEQNKYYCNLLHDIRSMVQEGTHGEPFFT